MRFNTYLFSSFEFNRGEQKSILILLVLIGLASYFRFFYKPKSNSVFTLHSEEITCLQEEMDTLIAFEIAKRIPKLYPFNPNFITDYKGYKLGMTQAEINLLHQYRAQGKWINSKADFKRVTGVSKVWLDSISPYFKFPNWVKYSKLNSKTTFKNTVLSVSEKKDLNKIVASDLQQIFGVGEVLSERIINYRNTLGGFSADVQLYAVYGLSNEVVQRIQERFTVKTPKPIETMNLNDASASDIATLPGISFETAKTIWEFVQLREGIKDLSELKNIETLNPQKIALIELYLHLE